MKVIACFKLLACLWVVACLTAIVGCATKKPVDWASRVGNYTYNQAVLDLGPPDKQTTLDDGRTVAEWITRTSGSGFGIGTGFSTGGVGVGVGRSSDSTRNHVIRLTFGSNGLLETWFKN